MGRRMSQICHKEDNNRTFECDSRVSRGDGNGKVSAAVSEENLKQQTQATPGFIKLCLAEIFIRAYSDTTEDRVAGIFHGRLYAGERFASDVYLR